MTTARERLETALKNARAEVGPRAKTYVPATHALLACVEALASLLPPEPATLGGVESREGLVTASYADAWKDRVLAARRCAVVWQDRALAAEREIERLTREREAIEVAFACMKHERDALATHEKLGLTVHYSDLCDSLHTKLGTLADALERLAP